MLPNTLTRLIVLTTILVALASYGYMQGGAEGVFLIVASVITFVSGVFVYTLKLSDQQDDATPVE